MAVHQGFTFVIPQLDKIMNYSSQLMLGNNWYRDMPSQTHLLQVNSKSLFARLLGVKGRMTEIPLENICDYKEVGRFPFYKGLILYVIDQEASLGEWKKVRKLRPFNTVGMRKREYQQLMEQVKNAVYSNAQLGVRKKSWFYAPVSINLELG